MTTATAPRPQHPPWSDAERRRLVRLCALLTGDRNAAEDLAQETLLEAWRHRHRLHDPAGADRWLSAIARNVCRRWARRRSREPFPHEAPDATAADGPDSGLEQLELAALVGRALDVLPPGTREALLRRYVDDAPHAEIARRLGVSEDAVSMRLTRGKAALRRELGLAEDDGWRETRVWCADCGSRTLLLRRAPDVAALRCPGCTPSPAAAGSRLPLDNPAFARLVGGVVRPTAIADRAAAWSCRYFAPGAGAHAPCTRCGGQVRLERYARDAEGRERLGLLARCGGCGEEVSSSLAGMALGTPELRALRRGRRRVRRTAQATARGAVLLRYEPVAGGAGVEVAFAADSLRLLHARAG